MILIHRLDFILLPLIFQIVYTCLHYDEIAFVELIMKSFPLIKPESSILLFLMLVASSRAFFQFGWAPNRLDSSATVSSSRRDAIRTTKKNRFPVTGVRGLPHSTQYQFFQCFTHRNHPINCIISIPLRCPPGVHSFQKFNSK